MYFSRKIKSFYSKKQPAFSTTPTESRPKGPTLADLMRKEDEDDAINQQQSLAALSHHDHRHQHGCVMVDLDEAVHGLYAGAKYVVEGNQSSPSHFADVMGQESHQLSHHPLTWMRDQSIPHGVGDFAVSLGLGAMMLPLSGLAIHAGIEETHAARKKHAYLKARQNTLTHMRDRLDALQDTPLAGLSHVERMACTQEIEDNRHQTRLNKLDGGAGLSSLLSGATIAAKVAEEVGVKSGLAIAAKSMHSSALVSHSAVACGVGTSAGIASQIVLAPLAGLSALSLGIFFSRHSHLSKRRLHADIANVERAMASLDPSDMSPQAQRYHQFLTIKLKQRDRYQRNYHNWNMGFVSGSAAYTASSVAKAGIGIAALAGASVATGPIGMAALIGVGVAGALTMGVSAHQYLLGHGKNKRYQGYENENLPGVDHQFLVIVDALATQSPRTPKQAVSNGFELRAALYCQIDGQEKALSDLLCSAANSQGKHYSVKQRSTDAKALNATTHQQVGWGHQAKAYLHAGSVYSHERLHHSHGHARQQAEHAFAEQSETMTTQSFVTWLDQPNNVAPQMEYMKTVLELQQAFLQTKIATHHHRVQITPLPPLTADATPDEQARYADQSHAQTLLIEQMQDAHTKDVALLQQITRCLADINRPTLSTESKLPRWRETFLKIQLGEDATVNKETQQFARFCLKDAIASTTAKRGILLATELKVARLANHFLGPTPTP